MGVQATAALLVGCFLCCAVDAFRLLLPTGLATTAGWWFSLCSAELCCVCAVQLVGAGLGEVVGTCLGRTSRYLYLERF